MNNLYLLLIVLGSIIVTSCGDDNEEQFINYDGDNVTGPVFNEGAYVTAARFPANIMNIYNGNTLEAVDVYIMERPSAARLVILRGDGNSGSPTGEISGQSLGSLTENSWNRIALNQPLEIDGSEIWIGVDFSVNSSIQVIGCDAGPANTNGDFILEDLPGENNQWTTFRDYTTTESINWNIRGVLSF